jgi:dihydrofolate synthase / folylpolyglutamate synthase
MNYTETLSYLFAQLPMYQRIGAAAYKADLGNTVKLCRLAGNPQERLKTIHVAGTNGKGSTSHMLASIMQEKGLKTGLYTSPHLRDFRERIMINGKMIPKGYVSRFVAKYKKNFERISPSFFEMTVMLAFSYFFEEKVDIAVIEVGMGGRLDSTNVITPLVSVITNISFDHMQYLGDTLEKIAVEKAGIIKSGVPVVIGETQEETARVFAERAASLNSGILFADSVFAVRAEDRRQKTEGNIPYPVSRIPHPVSSNQHPASRIKQSAFSNQPSEASAEFLVVNVLKNGNIFLENLKSPLAGTYQKKNIATVMGTLQILEKQGFSASPDEIRRGIEKVIRNTHFAGRWQVLSHSPLTICDAGHNEGGIREVLRQISTMKHDRLHFVLGMVNDKDITKILSLLPKDAIYYFCKADIPRGMDAGELKKKAAGTGFSGKAYPSVREALKAAQENASEKDLVFVGGSTFVVAEVV